MMIRYLLIVLVLVRISVPAYAAPWSIDHALTAYLKANYPWPEIEMSDVTLNGTAPNEPPLKIFVDKGPLPGKAVFTLEFRDGKRLTASALVKAYDRIVVSRRPFERGYVLQDDDVYETLMDVTRIPKTALKDMDQIVGKSLAQSIFANMPIQRGMVSDSARLKSGRKVVLMLEAAGFSIRAVGELKQSGFVGEYVRVLNPASKKTLTGLLIDENTVKVEF